MKTSTRLLIGLGVLILATPLGKLAPGTAWGEWSVEELHNLLGWTPEGFQRFESLWRAKLPDYSVPFGPFRSNELLGYLLSAILGVGVVLLFSWLMGRWLAKGRPHAP